MNKKIFAAMFLSATVFLGCGSESAPEPQPIANEVSDVRFIVQKKIAEENLIIYTEPEKYSYENLVQDIEKIQVEYPQVKVMELAETADGRKIYDLVIGDLGSQNQILIFGAMHAREYITTQIVMRQFCDALDAVNGFGGEYRGIPTQELLKGVTIHFIPNSNPDGVAISQFGLSSIRNENLRGSLQATGGDFIQWKANAAGVDLNRNFDAGWQEFRGSSRPASERYKGAYPGSEPESAALIKLIEQYPIKRTISYHTVGALIYWFYKQEGETLTASRKFANAVSQETGYYLDDDYTAVDAAGFKDWAVYKKHIPSLTIETGAEHGNYTLPVPQRNFAEMWRRNKNVVYATVYDLK